MEVWYVDSFLYVYVVVDCVDYGQYDGGDDVVVVGCVYYYDRFVIFGNDGWAY